MCLPEAHDIVRRCVTHAFACGSMKVAWLRCFVKTQNHHSRYWSVLTSLRTRRGVTHVLPKKKRPNRQRRLSPIFIGRDDWI
jgi:hypothetical protein